MEVKVCVGSACYVKGSHDIIEGLQSLIKKNHLEEKVILKAAFCLGHCTEAVSVEVDGTIYSVCKDEIGNFFEQEVGGRLKPCK